MRSIIWSLLLVGSSASCGDVTEVMIPGKNWGISFSTPTISHYKGQTTRNGFQYMATSVGTPSIMLSFFLEEDSSGSNRECFESYWSKTKRNPIIVPSSVRAESSIGYEKVHYKYAFGQPHANFYFVNHGYCIDVHVSLSEESNESERALSTIGESLKIIYSR